MCYTSPDEYLNAEHKRIMLFGMSGLGKTYISTMLRDAGEWFHYSVDYRIGTRYMGELITDNFKREAMKVPFLRDLLLSDSVYIASNITFDNLAPLSTYLGKPGDPVRGGLDFATYLARQEQHRAAEIAAMYDTANFITRAREIYGYPHFICDTSGSICEIISPEDPQDPVMHALSQNMLPIWIKGSAAHTAELIRRFDKAPKPMYYQPAFLKSAWAEYSALHGEQPDPDAFIRWTYARALAHRQPRYAAMARWGVTVLADDVARVKIEGDFHHMIAAALAVRSQSEA